MSSFSIILTTLVLPLPGPEAPVKITVRPVDANVPPYVDVMFNCSATGNPRTTITWTQDGNTLPQDKRLVDKNDLSFNLITNFYQMQYSVSFYLR